MRISYEQYHGFSADLEGRVPKMYCDVFGYITTGVGNLINTLPEALALPWLLADGSPASEADITADFNHCRASASQFAKLKWMRYADQLRCHISEDAIDDLVKRTLARNEAHYRKRWPKYDAFPADAQLAINSMGWAVGAGFYLKFPNLAKCIDAEDWAGCVASCKIRDGLDTPQKSDDNLGIVPRNARNKVLFANAQVVKERGLDPNVLHWPNSAKADTPLPTVPPTAAIDAVADLKAAAVRAMGMTDVVGTPGSNLRKYESGGDDDEGGPQVA